MKEPVIKTGMMLRDTPILERAECNNEYGWPGGWNAMMEAMTGTGGYISIPNPLPSLRNPTNLTINRTPNRIRKIMSKKK